MKELPKYYVIKRDPSNPLWEKFSKWAKKKYNIEWAFVLYNYYGYDGHSTAFGFACQDNINNFQNSPTLITLEQWDEAVNPFVLPEKWCVKRTPENAKVINDWANGKYGSEKQFTADGFVGSNFCRVSLSEGYTEITFDQFKKEVLKENDMSKEEIKVGDWVWSNTPNVEREILGNDKGFFGRLLEIDSDNTSFKISVDINIFPNYKGSNIYNGVKYVYCETCRKATREEIDNFNKHNQQPMKDRTITAAQAQSIIDVACCGWAPRLAEIWGKNICIKNPITITESFYKEMRSACNPEQHKLFDSIFGKDKKEFSSIELKTGEWIRTKHGNTYLRVENQLFCKDNGKVHDMTIEDALIGKKVKIKSIEFEEEND